MALWAVEVREIERVFLGEGGGERKVGGEGRGI